MTKYTHTLFDPFNLFDLQYDKKLAIFFKYDGNRYYVKEHRQSIIETILENSGLTVYKKERLLALEIIESMNIPLIDAYFINNKSIIEKIYYEDTTMCRIYNGILLNGKETIRKYIKYILIDFSLIYNISIDDSKNHEFKLGHSFLIDIFRRQHYIYIYHILKNDTQFDYSKILMILKYLDINSKNRYLDYGSDLVFNLHMYLLMRKEYLTYIFDKLEFNRNMNYSIVANLNNEERADMIKIIFKNYSDYIITKNIDEETRYKHNRYFKKFKEVFDTLKEK
jgi:hypothetical protein